MERYQYEQFAQVDQAHWWFIARREVLQSLLKPLIPKDPQTHWLDIGCGTGGMIPLLSQYSQLSVAEPDAETLAFTQARYTEQAIAFHHGNTDTLSFEPECFDRISAFDVLEHCADDHAALSQWLSWLKPGGYLILTVPAFACLWGENDVLSQHYRRYTKTDLQALMATQPVSILKCTYMNWLLFPLVWLARRIKEPLFRKLNPKSPLEPDDFKLLTAWLNCLLQHCFSWEQHWLPQHNLPWGSSLVIILRKNAD